MRVDFNYCNVRPNTEALSPELIISIRYNFTRGYAIPLEIYGELKSASGTKIANVFQKLSQGNTISLYGKTSETSRENYEIFTLIAPLSKDALEHIQDVREKDPKKDVHFNLKLFCKFLTADINISPQQNNANFLYTSGDSLLSMQVNEDSKQIDLPASTWTHEYLKVYEKNNYLILEIPKPEITKGYNFLEEKINAAIDAIPKMEKELMQGEWTEVIEKARPIIELMREKEREQFKELTELLIRSGLSEDSVKNLTTSLNQLFQFSSIFIHKIGDGGRKLNPEIIATKEDAYLIYSMCLNLIHLITKKIQRLS